MKIYLAGISTSPEALIVHDRFLESFYYFKAVEKYEAWIRKHSFEKDLFLDSGAFSVFTTGVEIKLEDYMSFLSVTKSKFKVIANLDVIGNSEATYANWKILQNAGINALPVIHYGAEQKWFEKYLVDEDVEYLALGGLVPYAKQRNKLRSWLDHSFSLVKKYKKTLKVHLFGITSPWVLQRYPAYSCDSTGWLYAGKRGRILEFHSGRLRVLKDTRLFSQFRKYTTNNVNSAKAMSSYEKYLTKLWASRGIIWND